MFPPPYRAVFVTWDLGDDGAKADADATVRARIAAETFILVAGRGCCNEDTKL